MDWVESAFVNGMPKKSKKNGAYVASTN